MTDDRILLEGLEFYGYHGFKAPERELGQRFVVDLVLMLDLRDAGKTDDIARTVDYGAAYRTVKEIVEGTPYNLIEAVAERIAAALLDRFPIERVIVRVNKPGAPIAGAHFSRVAIEITRARGDLDAEEAD